MSQIDVSNECVSNNQLTERVDASGAAVPAYAVCTNTTPEFKKVEMALETMYSEVKSLLPPLSSEESAELDAGRAETAEPNASNTVDYDQSAEVDIMNNAASGVAGSRITWYNAKALLADAQAGNTEWNVSAMNDNGQSDGFATFASTWLDQIVSGLTPVVNEQTDTYGRRFFSFENGIMNNTVAIVFEVHGRKMIKISDILLPLDEFLSLVSCDLKGEDPSKVGGELRSGNEVGRIPTYVECVFPTRALRIYNTNTVMIMSILTRLSTVFAKDTTADEQSVEAVEPTPVVEKTGYSWLIGSLAGAFVSGIVYGAALLSQRCKT